MTISTQQASSTASKLSALAASATFVAAASDPATAPHEVAVDERVSDLPYGEITSDEVANNAANYGAANYDVVNQDIVSFQLPAQLAQAFRAGAGDELSDFASYALTRFLLREHWVEREDCALLPFMVQMTNDVVDYQLAADAAAAVAQAEAAGDETALQVELDLGLTIWDEIDDETDQDETGCNETDE